MSSAVKVENLSKAYRLGLKDEMADTLMGAVKSIALAPVRNFKRLASLNTFRSAKDSDGLHWALRDVSFEVEEGDVVGIIGRNGAGKSTLLKILSRITQPTSGRATIRGRVSSLLEVGTGFHPELSGRENIYMNGTILGMRKAEIDRKFDQIVEFSGVEKFLDTPIKRYSSGMKVRLAFSVAAHLEPEILVIDEVLAVGDQEFQNKCLGKMQTVASSGRTVLFVSHNMAAVDSLCNRGILLVGGQIDEIGSVSDVVKSYMAGNVGDASYQFIGEGLIRKFELVCDRKLPGKVELGQSLEFQMKLESESKLSGVVVGLAINDPLGRRVVMGNTRHQFGRSITIERNASVSFRMSDLRLVPSIYDVDLFVSQGSAEIERVESICQFEVIPKDIYGTGTLPKSKNAVIHPDITWSVESNAKDVIDGNRSVRI